MNTRIVPPDEETSSVAADRASSPYLAALAWLLSFADYERRPSGHRFSLERPRRLLELLGQPQERFRSIVIAGTKGKGSTAAILQSLLRASGQRTALYTQPHLHSYCERVRVDGQLIPEDALAALVERLRPAVETLHQRWPALGRLTTYEIGTAAALLYFAEQRADWAVLEVGLGGRLDAVNAVRSEIAVLTPISLDHTDVLGTTIAAIAREKAGIIHPHGVVVSAPQPAEAQAAFESAARERGAELRVVSSSSIRAVRLHRFEPATPLEVLRRTPAVTFSFGDDLPDLALSLAGRHQTLNAATALTAARAAGQKLTPSATRQALRMVNWPGRLEVVAEKPLIIVDGAHNDASAGALAQALRDHFRWRRLALILGTSTDKNLDAILAPLVPLASQVIATQAHHPRAQCSEVVAAAALRTGARVRQASTVSEALALARQGAAAEDAVVVTGSLFVVAEARAHLGWAIPGP